MDIKSAALGLLQGETLRVITYGAAVTVWVASHVAKALNVGGLQAFDFDAALAGATGAVALLTELGRRYVYSPATVASIVEEIATEPHAVDGVEPEGIVG